jgi:hypothetical protein
MRNSKTKSDAEAFLRDAITLRMDAVRMLKRGLCRYASPLEAAEQIGRAYGRAWPSADDDLVRRIRAEWRRIRNLNAAYEKSCVGHSKMRAGFGRTGR